MSDTCPEAIEAPLTKERYRDAMASVAAAVNVVTTDGPAGRAGFTATAVCSVTDAPPTLLVCVKRDSSVGEAFRANGALCVNTLAPEHVALSNLFGGRTHVDERFAAAVWTTAETGAPVLEGALASFDCRVASVVDVGTHAVLFCEVVAIGLGEPSEALIYVGRRYDTVAACA
ncbi:flavin reductase [Hansschlegelia sp. KR7-227]|jgi:flavin reductase|uniref:flavin reductase n=1 Tax=Hansschlegelia sp. KR7-227 TaxID=3400914 RepID=UPI003C08039F